MVTTVRSRPNHYETLGLAPTAASDEIARAFTRETSVLRPHAFGGVAGVTIAYDTLRDPIKRRAYDASLGLRPEPDWRNFSTGPREASSFPASVSMRPTERPAMDPIPPAVPKVSTKPRSEPELRHQPGASAEPRLIPQIGGDRSGRLAFEERWGNQANPIEWKSAGVTIGGLFAVACLAGGLAGWWSISGAGAEPQPKRAVSVSLPPAKPVASTVAPRPAPVKSEPRALPDRPERVAKAAAQIERMPPPKAIEDPSVESQVDSSASEQAAVEAPVVSTVAAGLPLPNKTIARTIERIGYSCGEVASTIPVGSDAPGVFKVTCTSGQSYQASPVNGRYHFRRSGRH